MTDASASGIARPCENILDQYNNKLYGSFWLLEEISRQKGVYEDLLEVFQGNIGQVHEVMSLAFSLSFRQVLQQICQMAERSQNTAGLSTDISEHNKAYTKHNRPPQDDIHQTQAEETA